MEKITSYRLCFTENTFTGEMICQFIKEYEKHLGFMPSKIVLSSAGIYSAKVITDKILKKVASIKDDIALTILDNSEKLSFDITFTANRQSCQSITFSDESEKHTIRESVLDSFINNKNFIVGYGYDSEFARWQSEINPSHYQIFDKPMIGVKLYWNDFFNEQQIDIKANPGRMTLVKGMWLSVTPIMYFGRPIFNYIPENKLINYKSAISINKVNEDVIKIVLFENIFEAEEENNYQKLKDFRRDFAIDELEAKLT